MDKLESELGSDSIIKLRLHSNPNDEFYLEEVDKRGQMYERKSYPTIAFNGNFIKRSGMTEKEVEDTVSKVRSSPLSFNVSLNGKLKEEAAGQKIDFEAMVEQFGPLDQATLRYTFFLFEDNVDREDQYFQHVVHAIKPSAKGTTMRIKNGETKKLTASFDLKEEWTKEELGAAVAIFDQDTFEVYAYGVWKFKAPHLVNLLPGKVSPNSPLSLSFDKDIDPATFNEGTVLLVDQNGLAVPGKASVSGLKCTFAPNKAFEKGKKYAFYAKSGQSGIKSKTGEKLIGNIIWKFECEKVAEEPKLEVAEKSFDLGEISTTIIKKLAFKNTGTGKLSATIKSSESWLRSENSEFEIEPGGSFETTATVDPLGLEPGPYSGKLSIESNGGNLEIAVGFTYKKSGMILKVEPSELDFGKIPKNTKKSLQIEIIEQAGEGGMIEGTVTASVPWIKVDPSSFKCDRCKISITVEPSTEGALTGEVTIDSNAGKIVVPVKVMVESAALLDLSVNGFSGAPLKTTSPSYTIPISTTKGATVMVGGKPATVDQNGKANYSVTLIPGLNRFEISATLGSQNKKITVDVIYAVTIELWLDKTDITINGLKVTLKTAPTSSSPPLPKELGGSTYMPIREVAEALGAQVGYDGAEKKVTLTQSLWNGKNVVELWIGKKTAKINGKEVFIDSKAQKLYPTIISAKTMLPLRFVGEALGAGVVWEGATRKITLTYPK